jgi:hypothetical protein
MISYRDMTFCIASCANRECPRKYSEDVRNGAVESDLPVSLADLSGPCFAHVPLKEKSDASNQRSRT